MANEYLILSNIYDLLLFKEAERLGVMSTEEYKEYVINVLDSKRKISEYLNSYGMHEDFERTGNLYG